jgi:Asp-tRNA(Asn)/Glu-tRNA(Gln) amidotransferase A subunit family amidase
MAAELLALLGLEGMDASSGRFEIPASLAISDTDHDGIGIVTRTIHELVEIMSAAVQVPDRDQRSGVAAEVPRQGRAGRQLKIHYSDDRPDRAYVMLEYRDGWFFIDEADQATKRYFKLLGSLWSSAMAETLGNKAASPVLTVPVSR